MKRVKEFIRKYWVTVTAIIAASLSAANVDGLTLTTWTALGQFLWDSLMNPVTLALFAVNVMGILNNPNTKGVGK